MEKLKHAQIPKNRQGLAAVAGSTFCSELEEEGGLDRMTLAKQYVKVGYGNRNPNVPNKRHGKKNVPRRTGKF